MTARLVVEHGARGRAPVTVMMRPVVAAVVVSTEDSLAAVMPDAPRTFGDARGLVLQ